MRRQRIVGEVKQKRNMTEELREEKKKAGSYRGPKQPGTHYPEHPVGPLHTLHSPTYSSHDVILQRGATLSDITAHRPAQTARDKPDECFSARTVLDIRISPVLHAD